MSYDNKDDLGTYFATSMKMLSDVETIPYPPVKGVLEDVSLWGVQKCLDEIRIQITMLQHALQDVAIQLDKEDTHDQASN